MIWINWKKGITRKGKRKTTEYLQKVLGTNGMIYYATIFLSP